MTIKDFLKSIPEEFYYWIGIALFYLLSSIFKKREQQVDGAEKKSSKNTSLKSFLQNSLQIDTQRDIFGNLKNEPLVIENNEEETNLIKDNLDSEELTSPQSQINFNQPFIQDKKSTDINDDNQFTPARNPVFIKDLDKPLSTEDFVKAKNNKAVKIQGLAKLGLNENNDLKRAIIINEILSKPRAMKKNIR
tara:strand:- start:122 stop:697 length:576 start_codon:yes stop_codon:yes gene_type:complete